MNSDPEKNPENNPEASLMTAYGQRSTDLDAAADGIDMLDSIQIDPVIKEPKLDDPLMTSVKIGRTDADDRTTTTTTPETSANSGGGHRGSDDPFEAFLHRSRARCTFRVQIIQTLVHGFLSRHKQLIKRVLLVGVLLGYILYFCFAVWYSSSGALIIIILTSLVVLSVTHKLVMRRWGSVIKEKCFDPIGGILASRQCRYLRW